MAASRGPSRFLLRILRNLALALVTLGFLSVTYDWRWRGIAKLLSKEREEAVLRALGVSHWASESLWGLPAFDSADAELPPRPAWSDGEGSTGQTRRRRRRRRKRRRRKQAAEDGLPAEGGPTDAPERPSETPAGAPGSSESEPPPQADADNSAEEETKKDGHWVHLSKISAGKSSNCEPVDIPAAGELVMEDCGEVAQKAGANTINYREDSAECYAKRCSGRDFKLTSQFGAWDIYAWVPHGSSSSDVSALKDRKSGSSQGDQQEDDDDDDDDDEASAKQMSHPRADEKPSSSGCPSDLADVSSREVMQKAGWDMDIDNFESDGGNIKLWKSGDATGSLKIRFKGSGQLKAKVSNNFADDGLRNLVHVRVNGVTVKEIAKNQNLPLCFTFFPGDELELAEEYSQIALGDVRIVCGEKAFLGVKSHTEDEPGAHCPAEQQVKFMWSGCKNGEAKKGVVEHVFNSSMALIKWKEGQSEVLSTKRHRLAPDIGKSGTTADKVRCSEFSPAERPPVGILVVADKHFQRTYSAQIATQKCFAKRHGYELWILEGHEFTACARYRDFFFKKHCLVAKFLEARPPSYVAVVIDADVIGVVLERGLEQWILKGGDLQFYERATALEVAAGNYIAKNVPWTRRFLMEWANYEYKRPPGYSSSDNGALHVHVLEFLQLPGAKKCRDAYSKLRKHDPGGPEYWEFITGTKNALGPPRRWRVPGEPNGTLTVWPRLHFFVMDGVYSSLTASNYLGPVMHHGIKNADIVKQRYWKSLQRCELNSKVVLRSASQYGGMLLGLARSYPQFYKKGNKCKQCVERCVKTLSCKPLEHDESEE
eukprot:TRINITY_DN3564_c2_g1_i2.p1 TRINITY_DN3564_c2_g1~~TRINITY_DN3564_c2_g1_i2.p1  ORF type:complete len:826 (-),score=190.34 TRINITY_DN3564_c2_g1_i2:219-2696(-)